MTKKWLAGAVVAGLAIALSGCAAEEEAPTTTDSTASGDSAACETTTEVTWLGTIKIEIQDQFLSTVDAYNAAQDCYEIKVLDAPQGEQFLTTVTPLYAAGEAPVVMTVLQELPDMAERVMDLSGTELAALAAPGTLENGNIGGKQVGLPVTAEAFGLLYNKAVLDEAGVDPKAIKTQDDLEAAFQAVEATGRSAIHFSGLWWSLGAHVSNVYHANAGTDTESRLAVLDGLADGTKKLGDDPVWNSWADTFDLMKAYSIDTATISDDDYNVGVENLATGEVGFWFMGNWAEPNLLQTDPEGNFGVMPMPISNNASDPGNSAISVGVPFYFIIDEEQSTEEERAGALDFLTWMITTPEGQLHYAGSIDEDNMSFIPVYDGFTVSPTTYMANEIAEYINAGQSLPWINSYYPAGLQDVYGAASQEYYDGVIDRATWATKLEGAWAGAEKTWR